MYVMLNFSVNGKPEPLQTNEVKHIKKELRHIRDTCNRLLDKLDEREPQPTSEAVVDSSTSKGKKNNTVTFQR